MLTSPPDLAELEVSVFGPGVGECVVVHLGGGEWLVVDSCLDPISRRPAALDYLASLNVDVATAVRVVVVTHWHDDHMRGASTIVKEAANASFACSAALRAAEFQTFVAASRRPDATPERESGVGEFSSILHVLQGRRARGTRREAVGPRWTAADQLVYRRDASPILPTAEVFALSPSSATLSRGFHELAGFMPARGVPKRATVSVDPNETSLVLSVRLGDAHAILGSDLVSGNSTTVGWGAVLTTISRPPTPAQVYKVPHHGSENAHHPRVWAESLAPDVTAVLTPFSKGLHPLPKPADLLRLKANTSNVYCTSPRSGRATIADPMVLKTIREATKVFRPRMGKMGHVRVRVAAGAPQPHVELFGAAFAA